MFVRMMCTDVDNSTHPRPGGRGPLLRAGRRSDAVLVRDLTVAARNTARFAPTGVGVLNPFE